MAGMPVRLQTRPGARRGVTLIEIAIVVAILGIVAAMGASLLTSGLPSWRTRRGARELTSAISMCRQTAIALNTRCRIRLSAFDSDLDGTSGNVGAYFVEVEHDGTWDILPVDDPGIAGVVGEGTVVLSKDGEDELLGVSLKEWSPLTGEDGDDIVFDARGWLQNPTSDFDADGYITVTFVNKPARRRSDTDEWNVKVSRGGLVRMESSRVAVVGNGAGTTEASTAGSAGTGYSP